MRTNIKKSSFKFSSGPRCELDSWRQNLGYFGPRLQDDLSRFFRLLIEHNSAASIATKRANVLSMVDCKEMTHGCLESGLF